MPERRDVCFKSCAIATVLAYADLLQSFTTLISTPFTSETNLKCLYNLPQLPRRPRFIGGGDLDRLTLLLLLRFPIGEDPLPDTASPPRFGGGDLEYESSLLLLVGGGERESYDGDREYLLALPVAPAGGAAFALLTDELLRL